MQAGLAREKHMLACMNNTNETECLTIVVNLSLTHGSMPDIGGLMVAMLDATQVEC